MLHARIGGRPVKLAARRLPHTSCGKRSIAVNPREGQ
jgi:hypothetical protein